MPRNFALLMWALLAILATVHHHSVGLIVLLAWPPVVCGGLFITAIFTLVYVVYVYCECCVCVCCMCYCIIFLLIL